MVPNFQIFNKTFSAYMFCALIGIFVAGIFALQHVEKKHRLEYLTILLWSAVGVLIGGHLLYALTNIPTIIELIENYQQILREKSLLTYLGAIFGGNVFYGGLLGGLAAGYTYCRITATPFKKYLDVSAMFIPLFHVLGRIGCFLSGCCYGPVCSIGLIYQHSLIEAANHIRRFPIQLVEAAANLLIFLLLHKLFHQQKFKDQLLHLYFLIYPLVRFILEFYRDDSYRGFLLGLSTSQIISILLFGYSTIALIVKRRQARHLSQDTVE